MRQFSLRARIYLIGCYVLGWLALSWLVFRPTGPAPHWLDWEVGVGLAVVAACCQVFGIRSTSTADDRTDQLTPAPLFAALLLLPGSVLALVFILTFLPEWYVHRRKWFGQFFNIASYMIAAAVARLCFLALTGHDRLETPDLLYSGRALSVLLIIPVFLGIQTPLLAGAFALARGLSLRASGLFTPEKLVVEAGLVCVGFGFAITWLLDPRYGIVAILPLAAMFQALLVPNLREEAGTDPKTGLANMRRFNTELARALDGALRSDRPLSLLMCDLDHLRHINNRYGHQAGDSVLVSVAELIRHRIRGSDLAARFGGEEFVVLLQDTAVEGAQHVAESVRSDLAQARFAIGPAGRPISATISVGVAACPQHGRTADVLLHEADLAVYQAKRQGRNQVVVAGRASRALAGEWTREHLLRASERAGVPYAGTAGPLRRFVRRMTTMSKAAERHPATQIHREPVMEGSLDGGPAQRVPPSPHWLVLALIGAITTIALLGLWPGLSSTRAPWWPLLLFAGLTFVAEQFAVSTFSRNLTSVAVVAVLSATFLYDGPAILVTAAVLAGTAAFKARSPLHRMVFNFGTVLLSAEGAQAIFQRLSGSPIDQLSLPRLILPAIAAGLAYYAINHLLLCLIRGLTEHRRPWQIWHAEYRWLWPHYVVLGVLGLVTALGYRVFGFLGVLALMAPVAMMHLAIQQYMTRSAVYVDELRRMNRRLTDSYEATLQALTRALDTRDEETEEHSRRVTRYTELIAQRLRVPSDELEDITRGALLHDIGKIGVPDAILLKPGRLTEAERTLMCKHPEIGYSMITHIPFLARAAQVVLHHHEAYDGSGYPSGLAGTDIPLGARIFAIADTFDAMTSDRPYRKALPVSSAITEIARCRGTQFDPAIVDTFLEIPPAELVATRAALVPSETGADLLRAIEPALASTVVGQEMLS